MEMAVVGLWLLDDDHSPDGASRDDEFVEGPLGSERQRKRTWKRVAEARRVILRVPDLAGRPRGLYSRATLVGLLVRAYVVVSVHVLGIPTTSLHVFSKLKGKNKQKMKCGCAVVMR